MIETKHLFPIQTGVFSCYFGVYFELAPQDTVKNAFMHSMNPLLMTEYPVINLTIEAPCGEKVFYKTIDDLPQVDTPCTCGNPNHWFIKIGQTK